MNSAGRVTATKTVILRIPSRMSSGVMVSFRPTWTLKASSGTAPAQTAALPDAVKKIFDHGFHGNPGVGIIGLEHIGLGRVLDGFFQHDHGAPDIDVAPVQAIAVQGSGAPDQDALTDEGPDGVDGLAVDGHVKVFLVVVGNNSRPEKARS